MPLASEGAREGAREDVDIQGEQLPLPLRLMQR